MPGEAHGHIFMDGRDYKAAAARYKAGIDEPDLRKKLAAYQAAGIRFFRDGGDPYGASLAARRLAPEYGIDYRSPAFAIHRKGLYGGIVGRSFETMRDYHALVREAAAQRADFIKIMVSGIMDFSQFGVLSCPPLERAQIAEMVAIAHGEGFAVMAHANGEAVQSALEAGVDSIEHGNYPGADCVRLFAETGAFFVPTLSPAANLLGCGRFPDKVVNRIHQAHLAFVRQCAGAGVRIVCGSDAGAYLVPHARGTQDEAAYLAEAGLSPETLEANERLLAARFTRGGV